MYKIKGKYQALSWEDIDGFDTRAEAYAMLREYMVAFGAGWQFKIVRGRNK